jgi:anti-sigma factor RsiW
MTMTQNQEQIEARLCDYVEGTLTDAERADIEKHLASNPQHRKLIGELLKTRDLVRKLPRAKAPQDVAETLQGQLERSVLLGSMPDELPASHLRIGFWSRFRAIAAMLILAAGLGSVVFFMLRNTRSPELATLQPKITATEAAATSQPEGEAGALGGPVVMADSVADKAQPPVGAGETNGVAASAAPTPGAASPVSNAFANDSGSAANRRAASGDDAMFGTTLADHLKTGVGGNEAECIVSDAPSKDVIRYLQDNKISWRVEPMPQPLALNVNQSAAGSRLPQNSMRLESRPIEPVPRDRQEAKAKEQAPFGSGGGAKPATMPIDGSSLASNAPAQKQSEEDTKRALEAPATMPTDVALDALAQQQLQQRYICAPNLTRQQANDLRANLSRSDQFGESLAKRGAGRKQLAESPAPAEKDRDYGMDAARNAAPTTLPAANIAAMPAPTTQVSAGAFTFATTTPTTAPAAEQRFDVFIVVDAAAEAPTTEPSTQPSTRPATEPATDAVDDVTSFK